MFVINTKERFENEVENINQYVEYIEDNFYRNSCSTMRTEGFECLQELGDYVFDATENTDKENNSEIITRLGELVKNKITEYASKLTLFERKELPEISNSITEKDLDESLINYMYLFSDINKLINLFSTSLDLITLNLTLPMSYKHVELSINNINKII